MELVFWDHFLSWSLSFIFSSISYYLHAHYSYLCIYYCSSLMNLSRAPAFPWKRISTNNKDNILGKSRREGQRLWRKGRVSNEKKSAKGRIFQERRKNMKTSNEIREFTDTICTWADKGHLYQNGKNPQRWILDMRAWKLCSIIHLCTNCTFYDTQVEVFFSRGQTKGIHEAHLGLWQLLF